MKSGEEKPSFNIGETKGLSVLEKLQSRLETLEDTKTSSGAPRIFNPLTIQQDVVGILPPKFKMPDLAKFDGTTDPFAHVETYTWAMYQKQVGLEAMAHCFPQTLSGPARDWYVTLPNATKSNWPLACEAFQKQYLDNVQARTTKRDLEQTLQRDDETFSDFARRWRKKMMELVNRPDADEQCDLILKCLRPEYRTPLSTSYWPSFAKLHEGGIRFDDIFRETKERRKGEET